MPASSNGYYSVYAGVNVLKHFISKMITMPCQHAISCQSIQSQGNAFECVESFQGRQLSKWSSS